MAKEKVNPLTFFREGEEARKRNFANGGPITAGKTTTGVISDYSQNFQYGKTGTSFTPTTPAPAFKKGGAKKC